MPWEYRVLTDPSQDELNVLGRDGWQLGLIASRHQQTVCYLARPTGVDPQQMAKSLLRAAGKSLQDAASALHVAAGAFKDLSRVNYANAAHQAALRAQDASQGLAD